VGILLTMWVSSYEHKWGFCYVGILLCKNLVRIASYRFVSSSRIASTVSLHIASYLFVSSRIASYRFILLRITSHRGVRRSVGYGWDVVGGVGGLVWSVGCRMGGGMVGGAGGVGGMVGAGVGGIGDGMVGRVGGMGGGMDGCWGRWDVMCRNWWDLSVMGCVVVLSVGQ
jgi:hypothetical protein